MQVYAEIRQATYGTDLGQTGWMTADELASFWSALDIAAGSQVLEVGCGAGVCAATTASVTGAQVTAVDINENGIRNAEAAAAAQGAANVRYRLVDASRPLPFEERSFDAIYCNDAMCHIPDRLAVLRDWRRVLKPGGRLLFTDALVLTGIVTHEEIATRSSIGLYLWLPPGVNEKVIGEAGLELLASQDLTRSVEQVSGRWRDARAAHSATLKEIEGEATYEGLQRFFTCVHTLTRERRLSRFCYVARRPD